MGGEIVCRPNSSSWRVAASLLAAAATLMTGAANAQDREGAEALQEVVVTARKREESLQDIGASITAISGETLQQLGATQFTDYATTVPNLSFGIAGAGRTVNRQFQIRGLFGAGTSALYIDDTPVPVSVDPRVLDVERIEVLRGPQGSLFGSRSMGGVVRMITKQPSSEEGFAGRVHLRGGRIRDGGNDSLIDASLNIPTSERSALRVAAYYVRDGGFIDRRIDPDSSLVGRTAAFSRVTGDEAVFADVNEDRTVGAQLSWAVQVNDNIKLTPSIYYQKFDSEGSPFVDTSITNTTNLRQFNFEETSQDKWTLAALNAEFKIGVGTITSSTSFFSRKTYDVEDGTLALAPPDNRAVPRQVVSTAPVDTIQQNDLDVFTQEIRLASDSEGPWNYLVGVFYQDQDSVGGYPPRSIIPAGTLYTRFGAVAGRSFFSLDGRSSSKELGVFGEVSYTFADRWTLTGGGRWYDYKSDASRVDAGELFRVFAGFSSLPSGNFSQSENGFNPKLGLEWRATDDVTLFTNIAKGFRPGGSNTGATACAALGVRNVPSTFDSDSVWSYEIGAKTAWFDDRLVVNATAFRVDWSDYRINSIDCGLGFGANTNVGEARSQGAELELMLGVGKGLTFNLAAGYNDAEVTDRGTATNVINGQPLFNVPFWTGTAALDQRFPLKDAVTAYWRVDYRYVGQSDAPSSIIGLGAASRNRPTYQLVNARIGAKFGPVDASVYVDNAKNERANYANPIPLSDSLRLVGVNRPRTIGVDFRYEF